MGRGSCFQGFWTSWPILRLRDGRNFWFGMRHKIAWFYHVLSVSVVPSVSVESAMESHDVLNDVFLCCVFERYDDSVLLEETTFGGDASL